MTRNLPRDALLLLGLVAGIAQAAGVIPASHDAWYYWQADLGNLYPAHAWDPTLSGYIYPPPMAQLLEPFRWLPWPVVQVAVTTGLVAALWYCAGTWAWLFIGLGVLRAAFPVLPEELGIVAGYALNGNVQLGIAAVTVAGLRHPGLWAFPLLTKIGPGIGLLWFLFRREWWPLLVGIATTAVICGVSLVLAPTLWTEWLVFVLVNRDAPSPLPLVPVALPIRLAMSTALLAWAAPRGHRWAVPLAAGWAIPALYEGTYLGVWVAALHRAHVDEPRLRVGGVVEPTMRVVGFRRSRRRSPGEGETRASRHVDGDVAGQECSRPAGPSFHDAGAARNDGLDVILVRRRRRCALAANEDRPVIARGFRRNHPADVPQDRRVLVEQQVELGVRGVRGLYGG